MLLAEGRAVLYVAGAAQAQRRRATRGAPEGVEGARAPRRRARRGLAEELLALRRAFAAAQQHGIATKIVNAMSPASPSSRRPAAAALGCPPTAARCRRR